MFFLMVGAVFLVFSTDEPIQIGVPQDPKIKTANT